MTKNNLVSTSEFHKLGSNNVFLSVEANNE